jgi:hypothetical protein
MMNKKSKHFTELDWLDCSVILFNPKVTGMKTHAFESVMANAITHVLSARASYLDTLACFELKAQSFGISLIIISNSDKAIS